MVSGTCLGPGEGLSANTHYQCQQRPRTSSDLRSHSSDLCHMCRAEVAELAASLQADGCRIVEAALQLEADEEGTEELPGQGID